MTSARFSGAQMEGAGGGASAEVVEDPPDRELIGEGGDHGHPLAAASADEGITW